VEEARLEAELLLCRVLAIGRERLFTRLHEEIGRAQQDELEGLLARRLAHEPAAYIVGRREFYGLTLECSPAALIPRPETELLVELALEFLGSRVAGRGSRVVDVGTGNGAIAVAIAVNAPEAEVVGIDRARPALLLGRRNAVAHGVAARVGLVQGSLLGPLRGAFDAIVANLPYVPTHEYRALPPEIREHEPEGALHAGPEGTEVIEALLAQAPSHLRAGGLLLAEHGWDQAARLRDAARRILPDARIETRRDLAGEERVLVVRLG
jgi:release factor glutamine methyltransferase